MDDARFWERTASRLARRLNLGVWLDLMLPVGAVLSVLAACALLVLRRQGVTDLLWFWTAVSIATAVSGFVVLVVVRLSGRTTPAKALVWLEHRLRLHNRLSAAAAGVGPWPEPRADPRALLKWKAGRLLPVPTFSAVLLVAASWIPVSVAREEPPPPVAPPFAWTEMERWLDGIEKTELVDEQAVASWRERLESLRDQPNEDWYRHSSLEAGDSLRDELASELRALERGLSDAESSLAELLALDEHASLEKRRLSRERLGKALDDLDLLSLPLGREVKRPLMTLARERDVKPMTKEQIERLRERLRERQYADLPRFGEEAYAFLSPGGLGVETPGGRPGQGGVNRGPGNAPIELSDDRTELGTSRIEDVLGREPLGSEFGETVAVGVGEHEIETSGFRIGRDAGAVSALGEGGEIVWSGTFLPDEQRILKKYFK